MKILIILLFLLINTTIYAETSIFNIKLLQVQSVPSIDNAKDYIMLELKPLFPKDLVGKEEKIQIGKDEFIFISYSYTEFNTFTRTNSIYFFSIWKKEADNKYTLMGNNFLTGYYDISLYVFKNRLTLEAKKEAYDPSSYYFSFDYIRNNFYISQILQIKNNNDSQQALYFLNNPKSTVKLSSILLDDLFNSLKK